MSNTKYISIDKTTLANSVSINCLVGMLIVFACMTEYSKLELFFAFAIAVFNVYQYLSLKGFRKLADMIKLADDINTDSNKLHIVDIKNLFFLTSLLFFFWSVSFFVEQYLPHFNVTLASDLSSIYLILLTCFLVKSLYIKSRLVFLS